MFSKLQDYRVYLVICQYLIVTILVNGCFFVPSMNLPISSQQLMQHSLVNDVQIKIIPINLNTVESQSRNDYRIGAGDVLAFFIIGHPELSSSGFSAIDSSFYNTQATTSKQNDLIYGSNSNYIDNKTDTYVVNESGDIYLPYVGKFNVKNQTLAMLHHNLDNIYKDYFVNPNVYLKVAAYRSQKIYVMGEVLQPGIRAITDIPLSLVDAIQVSGSINSSFANVNQIYVLRKVSKLNVNAYWLDAGSVTSMLYGKDFFLQDGDIVYVSTAGVTQFNRVMNQLLPTAETIWYTKNSLPNNAFPGILN